MARQTQAGAALTRQRVIDAAVAMFSERGVRAATLEDVAARAGVTRGAVYGHFSGKPSLVAAVIDRLRWPLDIGDNPAGYRAHPQPLRRLHAQLHTQMARCLQDPAQWQVVTLVLQEAGYIAWPQAAIDRVTHLQARAVANLAGVMGMARERHQLRRDITPDAAARCLHAVGVGMLSEHASQLARGTRIDIPQCLQLFLEGIEDAPREAA